MKPCCGNCANWTDAKPTKQGKLPYYGTCKLGYPLKQGKPFVRKGTTYYYGAFTIRSDRCKRWETTDGI